MADARAIETVRGCGLAPAHEQAVLSANGEELIG
jgi:hypothetical protein